MASRAEQDLPETGEGSEYGRQWREEARQRRRGYASRKKVPDDHPWVLKEKKKGGKQLSVLLNTIMYVIIWSRVG